MKQIDHPNIVKLHNIFEDEKYLYIVMELLQGGEVIKPQVVIPVYSFLIKSLLKRHSAKGKLRIL